MMRCNKVDCVPLAATELTRILFHQYVQKALPTLSSATFAFSIIVPLPDEAAF